MELVCPAGNAAMIRSAVNRGADTVYIGLKDEASARHFSGPSFNDWQARESQFYVTHVFCHRLICWYHVCLAL